MHNSVLFGNTAESYGGAIFSTGNVSISNSSFSLNSAGTFGGALAAQEATLRNSTVSANTAPGGANLYVVGSLTLQNSILANATGPDCTVVGSVASALNNLIESTGTAACGLVNGVNGNVIGVDPALGNLGDNGGNTYTIQVRSQSDLAVWMQ